MGRSNRHRKPAPVAIRKAGRIVEIGAKGDGVLETEDGARAFAPATAPGDEGIFDVAGERATLMALTSPGQARIEPACPNYGVCGGCALQHVDDDFYGHWKRDVVVGALARQGIECDVAALKRLPAATRRRAVFAVQKSDNHVKIGFNQRRSSRITSIDGCAVFRPDLAAAMPALHSLAEHIPANAFDLAVTAADNGIDVEIRSRRFRGDDPRGLVDLSCLLMDLPFIRVALNGETLLEKERPFVQIGPARVTPPPGGFLQVSREGEAALAACFVPDLKEAKRVADLFCGVGAFALRLAQNSEVFAADGAPLAIAALEVAARQAHRERAIKPINAQIRDLDERPIMSADLSGFDAVVFDPPRAGAARQAEEIASSRVARVVAVSCNPSTFARDARLLIDGGYRLKNVTPVDQFVYTAHIELVATFEK